MVDSFVAGASMLFVGLISGCLIVGAASWGYMSPPTIYSGQVNGASVNYSPPQVNLIIGHDQITCNLSVVSGDQRYALTSLKDGMNVTIAVAASGSPGGPGCAVVSP